MAVVILMIHLAVVCLVVAKEDMSVVVLREQFARGHLPQYKKGMKSIMMRDEEGKPFNAIFKDDTNFYWWPDPSDCDVTFYLYTRKHNIAVQVYTNDSVGLTNTTFDARNPTIILVHGFTNSIHSNSIQEIREAYLSAGHFNIFGVDWSRLASGPWYNYATQNTFFVGKTLAEFIDYLNSMNVSLKHLHLIGHSLGAHVAGVAAKHTKAGKVARLTGLDPALPLFDDEHVSKRIDEHDAEMVDCIHTCGGMLGFYNPICSHDFYPNGGSLAQPGCFFDIFGDCSHGRSYQLYAESIFDMFQADQCGDLNDVKKSSCNNGTGIMGHHATGTPSGIYYLKTNENYPFNIQ